jgi:hypothetical protein
MKGKQLNNFITDALAIEAEEAKEVGALGFQVRALTQATMPHSKQEENTFTRRNGNFVLQMTAVDGAGLPYGALPRLVLSWLATEAVKTKNKEIILGDSLSEFMRNLDLVPTGGRWGSITRLKEQMTRLFSTAIVAKNEDETNHKQRNFLLVEDVDVWWEPQNPGQASLWESSVTLSDKFFREIIDNPIPVDVRALKALRRSPMALDIYCWLTYRMSYLSNRTAIPWELLQMQFGAEYKLTRQFKAKFLEHLKKVQTVYPDAKLETEGEGLILMPSAPHIARK